jgi:hypothetical protein
MIVAADVRIVRTYEFRRLMETTPSCDGTDLQSANVVNQCQPAYNRFGQLTEERQQHDGTVTANSPKVESSYTDGSSSHTRLTKITYPNGRVLHYGYDNGADNELNRITWLADDNGDAAGTHLAEYIRVNRSRRPPGRSGLGILPPGTSGRS